MRYLKQNGTPIKVGENKYKLIFTLNVIDELQDKTKIPLRELMELLTKKKKSKLAIQCLLKYLIEDHLRMQGSDEKFDIDTIELENKIDYYSLLLLETYIEQVKSKEIEGAKKATSSESEYEYTNVEYWFYIGTTILGFSEDKVWNMTLGKLITLRNEHFKFNGWIKEDKEVSIDEAIPL